ncbi:MAG: endonuclease NucS [Candidatus Saelkia tenebricola]|nr:endonuclease NucS [Candidatus Saelkia tenebricola]
MVFTHFKNNGASKSDINVNLKNNNDLLDLDKEKEIVELLFEGLSSLERGMRSLSRNITTPVGKISIIAVDMVGRVVIVEIGKSDVEDLIFKAIDHFDWALTHMKDLEERYQFYNIDPTLAPRIVILAPNYSEKFIKRATYLNPTFIDIYEYQIKESMGTRKVYFRPFSFINHKKWIIYLRTKSIDDHLNYLENDVLREGLKSLLVEAQSLRNDCIIDTSLGYVKFKDKSENIILGIYMLKNSFWINWEEKRWGGHFIKNKDDFNVLKTTILRVIRKEV